VNSRNDPEAAPNPEGRGKEGAGPGAVGVSESVSLDEKVTEKIADFFEDELIYISGVERVSENMYDVTFKSSKKPHVYVDCEHRARIEVTEGGKIFHWSSMSERTYRLSFSDADRKVSLSMESDNAAALMRRFAKFLLSVYGD